MVDIMMKFRLYILINVIIKSRSQRSKVEMFGTHSLHHAVGAASLLQYVWAAVSRQLQM